MKCGIPSELVRANFIVEWRADTAVTESLIESVMIGLEGTRTVSFTSSGRPISRYDE